MPYIVTTTSGQSLATIADNTIDSTTTSLVLVGKNYAGYGSFLNENFVKLIENFSNGTAPGSPLTGQLWWDSANTLLKVYTGNQWKQVHTSTAQASAPTNPIIGDLWWNTSTSQLNVYSGSSWIVVGPSTSGSGSSSSTGAFVSTITDTNNISHAVVELNVLNNIIGIVSKDSQFTPQTTIAGFANVYPGFNLISPSTLSGSQFTGTATNATLFNNLSTSDFLRATAASNNGTNTLGVGKLQVGSDLLVDPTSAGYVSVYSNGNLGSGTGKDIYFSVNKAGVQNLSLVLQASSGNLIPGVNNGTDIGSSSVKFANVWATTFRGTAITANYADLAERFAADAVYAPGTVVELGGINEITAAVQELSEAVFGVISTAAGFLMNGAAGEDATHPPVAMNGRVPVRVVGTVKKGDRLVSAGLGLARAATRSEITSFNVIGRALENKTTSGEGTVEAVVKINS
jgi:hypothetical protein